jgi:hypothetical protein
MWEVGLSGHQSTKAHQCQCLRMATLQLLEDVSQNHKGDNIVINPIVILMKSY